MMNLTTYITDPDGLQAFYGAIINAHETYAPLEKFGKFYYKQVRELTGCAPNSPIDLTMSIKPLFFPKIGQSHEIQSYQ